MAIRKVLGLAELDRATPAREVAAGQDITDLVDDLIDTMRHSPGCVGLAAPQIGEPWRVFVVDVSEHPKTDTCHGLIVLANPVIVERGAMVVAREGCMSVPDLTGDVPRAETIVVSGLDGEGEAISISTDAFEARALQHEIDHLDGLVFVDRVTSPQGLHRRRVYR